MLFWAVSLSKSHTAYGARCGGLVALHPEEEALTRVYEAFAVTGRGSIGTWILLVAHCCVGLPAAWQWASVTGGGPAALMQAHTGSWLLATLALAVCYATLSTAPPQAAAVTLEGPEFSLETSALSSARARGVRLAQPLLDRDGGPA